MKKTMSLLSCSIIFFRRAAGFCLAVLLVLFSHLAMPAFAEIVDYPGAVLQTVVFANSLAPSGSNNGKSNAISGNTVTLNSGYIGGIVVGAINHRDSNAVTNNTVVIEGGSVEFYVRGGMNGNGNAADNKVILNNGTLWCVDGGSSQRGDAINNSVIINGGVITWEVTGGASFWGNAIKNTVTINDGRIDGCVSGGNNSYGGGDAISNNVIIYGGAMKYDVYGGYIEVTGNAANNNVTMYGGTVSGSVLGGYNEGNGSVTDNSVTVDGGTVSGGYFLFGPEYRGVLGGYSSENGYVAGNSVIITSGTISRSVYGGLSIGGDASANRIAVGGGNVAGDVFGGWVDNGNAAGNSVTISNGSIGGNIYGGRSFSGYATANSITINGSMIEHDIFGGWSSSGNAINNNVFVNNGTVNCETFGGWSLSNNVSGNKVTVKGGAVEGDINGGWSQSGNVTNNNVTIAGGEAVGKIYGGRSPDNTVTNNSVIIAGGVLTNTVYGGFSNNGNAVNNSVTIKGNPVLTAADIYGGGGSGDTFAGNTLNVYDYSGSAAGTVQNFQFYNFAFSAVQTTPVLTADTVVLGDSTRDSVITAGTIGNTDPLQAGDTITLIDATALIDNGFEKTAEGLHGVALRYTWSVNAVDNQLIATLTGIKTNPQVKILSEGIAAGAILTKQMDIIADSGLLSALYKGEVKAIGMISGESSKYNTGSSIELNSVGITAGVAKRFQQFSAAILAEYANAGFNTEYDGIKGDGNAYAVGVGILAKQDIEKNLYVEGLIRGGQINNDYKSGQLDMYGTVADFDYSSMYFGCSLGTGYVYRINKKLSIDWYGKYTFTNIGGGETDLSTGEKYKFDSVLSNCLKAKMKGEYKIDNSIKPYIAVSYDHEMSGEVKAQIKGYDIEAPSFAGGTFAGELGANVKAIEYLDINLDLDLSAQFYTGVKEGFSGLLKMRYEF